MRDYQMFINGQWCNSSKGTTFASLNPYTQQPWALIPQAAIEDVEWAVQSATNAFYATWRDYNGTERAKLMNNLADLLEENANLLAEIETTDNGKVIRETKNQVYFAARGYRFFAGAANKIYGEVIPLDDPDLFDYTIRTPLGVSLLIISWNSPLSLIANKLAPALAAGNTVIIKPSEHASASTLEFAKLVEKAGFPPGVINVVTGDGEVGKYLTEHPGIKKISFTGGAETGKRIAETAARNLVPVTLELGGKSPNIVFEDAELSKAVIGAVAGIFAATGQTCIAGSRLLVQRSIYQEFVEKVVEKTKSIRLGNPLNPETEMGPVANKQQFDKILGMIEKAKAEGAQVITGGYSPQSEELQNGYFLNPTIFSDVQNDMEIACEEVFGPVLSIIPFEDLEEAIQIANDTKYGLAAGIWTTDFKKIHYLTRKLEAGTVWVNTYRTAAPNAPFGGIKNSGYGKERSLEAIKEFTYVKNVMMNFSDEERDPFSIKV
ncbi:aldehyde dehydrogenase (NAD+) [Lysinibacillus composti]|uniref:Aldehyde dehydrogenase n=1 Tax=Lysinibacillus composti TaxID=720633 RepID=A0A3N9UK58_9BACI|nr:aldehyde dehydrogenase [Lysinibacillus composti]MBM7607770.1 aldehyde dehydrogenase (NAD+) [Lysinibacillus composti]RQW75738.1 aldehyde dehydrogenase [Lysinibacillus composti]